jgi:GxxExxY protein
MEVEYFHDVARKFQGSIPSTGGVCWNTESSEVGGKNLEHGITRNDTEGLLHWDVSGSILEAAVKVHKTLGRGFLERVYVKAVAHELRKQGIRFEVEKHLKVVYDDEVVGEYVADMDVDEKVLVEFKACDALRKEHEAQLLNYLKASHRRVGLLLNFGGSKLESLRRVL